jgi:hypothetical protein
MKNKTISIICLVAIITVFGVMVPEKTYAEEPEIPRVLLLDKVSEFSVLEARSAQFGVDQRPPGGGGPAFFVSNAKVPNDIRYEIQFVLEESIDATAYQYLVFEMMGDTWEIMNDINEFYPRFRVGDVYVQFQGSFLFRGVIDRVLDGASRTWVTIAIPIAPFNIHANRQNFNTIMSDTNIFLLRFIANRAPIRGKLYFRNLRLQMDPA